jgi:hypothetical protein
MSHLDIVNRSQLFAAATAISAAGLLVIPAPAWAGPMVPLPLAPPCTQYVFTGGFSLRTDDGWQTFFSATGPSTSGGRAVRVNDDNITKNTGTVSGGGINGRYVDFNIRYDLSIGIAHYTGTVGDDGMVHRGVVIFQKDAYSTYWDSINGPLGCSTPAAPPPGPNDQQVVLAPGVKDPPPHQLGPQPPPAQAVATVTSDVDIYDAPGGNGNKLGILRSGRQVKLVGNCKPNDWCNLVIPELPGGSGWVWDTFLKF